MFLTCYKKECGFFLWIDRQKDDVLRQAYYKYAREDGHHPESYRVLKVLYERHIEGKHVPFQRYVITPEEREEIENDKQLPSYSRAFAQDARRSKCITRIRVGVVYDLLFVKQKAHELVHMQILELQSNIC